MKPDIVIMNLTHVYEQERFLSNKRFKWINCTDLNGTDCYCDIEAANKVKQRIANYGPEGIHFIDSGNYHYLSKFWIDKIKTPFSLIVFDHHPDMQPSLFDQLLSCGSWVKPLLDTHVYLEKVIIIGASDSLIANVDTQYGDKVEFYGESVMQHSSSWEMFSQKHLKEPVYISVDKDVLNRQSAMTNWDQGSLSLSQLEKLLSLILHHETVIGVDICGECSQSLDWLESQRELSLDAHANQAILNLILSCKR